MLCRTFWLLDDQGNICQLKENPNEKKQKEEISEPTNQEKPTYLEFLYTKISAALIRNIDPTWCMEAKNI